MKRVKIALGILLLLVFVALAVFLWSLRENQPHLPERTFEPSLETAEQEEILFEDGTLEEAYDCRAEISAEIEAGGMDYQRGSIIVSFSQNPNFDQAVSVLQRHGASPEEGYGESEFGFNGYIVASVSEGSEIDAICSLRGDDEVKGAILNVLIPTRQ